MGGAVQTLLNAGAVPMVGSDFFCLVTRGCEKGCVGSVQRPSCLAGATRDQNDCYAINLTWVRRSGTTEAA